METASKSVIFDRALLRSRRCRAALSGPSTFLLERVALDLADRLAAVLRRFDVAIDLGTPGTALRRELAGNGRLGCVIAASSILAARAEGSGMHNPRDPFPSVVADEECLPFGEASLDLVASALSLQFVNDLPGALIQIRRALKPDGLFLAALAGGDTLAELRECFVLAEMETTGGISPRVAPFLDVREAGALLQRAGFALPVADVERLTVRYPSAVELMRDLRAMGAANPMRERSRRLLRRDTLNRMLEIYAQRFADADKRVRATFDIVWLSGWGPDPTQQKPLPPGSARHRLADALGTKEVSAGEKAGSD